MNLAMWGPEFLRFMQHLECIMTFQVKANSKCTCTCKTKILGCLQFHNLPVQCCHILHFGSHRQCLMKGCCHCHCRRSQWLAGEEGSQRAGCTSRWRRCSLPPWSRKCRSFITIVILLETVSVWGFAHLVLVLSSEYNFILLFLSKFHLGCYLLLFAYIWHVFNRPFNSILGSTNMVSC